MTRLVMVPPKVGRLTIRDKTPPVPDFIWWKLTETAGNIAVDSGQYGYHVTNLSNPAWDMGLVCAGVCGGSVQVAQSYRDPPTAISAWLTPTARSDKTLNNYSLIPFPPNAVSNDIPAQGGFGIGINKWTDGDARSCACAEEAGMVLAADVPAAGQRYHLVVSYGADGITVWMDAVVIYNGPYANPANGTTIIHLGKHNDDTGYGTKRFFRGTIRDVRIYKRALTQDDIDALWGAGPTTADWSWDWHAATTDVTGWTLKQFAGGASFPAGTYRAEYVSGGIDYNEPGGHYFTTGGGTPPGDASGPWIYHSGGANFRGPGKHNTQYATVEACEADNAGQYAEFTHTGGQISLRLEDIFGGPYLHADNIGTGLTYRIRRIA